MSAFVVSKREIDVLVTAGLQLVEDSTTVEPGQLDDIGQRLLSECVRSVSYRYPNDDLGGLPGCYVEETICPGIQPISVAEWLTPYTYTAPDEVVTRDLAAETIRCYEYQSCEHPEWEDSWAHKFTQGLSQAVAMLPAPVTVPESRPDPAETAERYGDLSRDETIRRIRSALKRRSGKAWSVTGGRGTGYGWIHIQSPPKRRTGKHVQKPGAAFGEYEHVDTGQPQEFGLMTPQDCAELGELLGLGRPCHHQGESIPASSEYRREYIDRAEGREPDTYGSPYWD